MGGVPLDIKAIGNSIDTNVTKANKDKVSDDNFQQYLEKAYSQGDQDKLKKACDDFESIFMNMMFKEMRATVQKAELTPSDSGRDVYEGMLDEELMNNASKSGGVGLSKMLFKQLSTQMKEAYTPESVSKAVIEEKE